MAWQLIQINCSKTWHVGALFHLNHSSSLFLSFGKFFSSPGSIDGSSIFPSNMLEPLGEKHRFMWVKWRNQLKDQAKQMAISQSKPVRLAGPGRASPTFMYGRLEQNSLFSMVSHQGPLYVRIKRIFEVGEKWVVGNLSCRSYADFVPWDELWIELTGDPCKCTIAGDLSARPFISSPHLHREKQKEKKTRNLANGVEILLG